MSAEQREALEAGLRQAAFPPQSDISERRQLLQELIAGQPRPGLRGDRPARRLCHRHGANAPAAELHRGGAARDGGALAGAAATPFASALRKVLAAAPAARTARDAQLADRVRLILTRSAVPLALQEAIIARHVLRLRYRDRHDVMTCREVEPVAFAETQAHWYLVGWCRLRRGTRAFRLDQIHAAADTGEPALHRSYGDLDVDTPTPWPAGSISRADPAKDS